MKHILGISAGFHDAALSVIRDDGEILFAAHSERYSGIKHDPNIHVDLATEVSQWPIHEIAYYERPWLKQLRRLRSGEGIQSNQLTTRQIVNQQLPALKNTSKISSWSHHLSHAAAGFQTSAFDRAAVVVIDAVGEFDTISIYQAWYDQHGRAQYRRVWRQLYPHSIGMFYSAVTERVGLKPMDEEYITMGMAAYSSKIASQFAKTMLRRHYIRRVSTVEFRQNLHIGMHDSWSGAVESVDLASAAQQLTESFIESVMVRARRLTNEQNLVYTGGVALNCVANRNLGEYFEHIWIMPNPGDAGSSLGAAALQYGRRLNWVNAYLGHNIPGPYPVNSLLDGLLADSIVGVASGRAEFGPRALGNRSLLADPRSEYIKDRVNEIKRRQKFRPFAPVILAEMADQYFDMPTGWTSSPYMQSIARCRMPDYYPAICHVDGTSRVQTVSADGSGIRELLEKWFVLTGCPMLLNTSLNIRGEPMVNNRADADRFEQQYNVQVFS